MGVSLALLFVASAASAASIGTVTHLDGTLLVSRANGSVKVLGVDSPIEQGDILSSRKQTYVTVTLADNSSVTLGPDTDLKVERYVFHKHVPDNDGALYALARGSVRITAGVLGTRSGETVTLATPTANLDIPGASLIAEYVAPEPAKLAFTYPSTQVVPKQRADQRSGERATERGGDCILRALHLAAQAGQAATASPNVFASANSCADGRSGEKR